MITINMLSKANQVKGQGVLSAHDEQVNLVKKIPGYHVCENKGRLCDIMHYHTINFRYFLTLPFAKMQGKTVGYVHFLPETLENSIKLPRAVKHAFYRYVLAFYKAMDYLVVVNPYFIPILEKYGVDSRKVTYIPNFVSSQQFFPMEQTEKRLLKKRYGIAPNRFTVLCVGQLQTRKGVADFIEVAKKRPDMQFLWAGGAVFGKISDGYEEIAKMVQNPPENVRFLGLVEREKMNELYNLADVMFLPSYEELFPMTVLEAMNCKTPILLRDIALYKNILFNFYLKASDNDGFSSLLGMLQHSPEFYQKAAEAAWQGHKFYCKEHVSAMWNQFYQQVNEELPSRWTITKLMQQKS